ncbi:hypothetical protein DFH27DRAFT_90501 [Peziza echinospora]|nr:hypothetical protein DFH27DRAFT_90501 [Peziza echinospora]
MRPIAPSHAGNLADAPTNSNSNVNGGDGLFDAYSYERLPDYATEEDLDIPPEVDERGGADYYAILVSPRDATPNQLRAAYRHLSLFFHPDKQPPHLRERATERFNLVKLAYETLMDPHKRAIYDTMGVNGLEARDLGPRGMPPQEFRAFIEAKIRRVEREKLERMVSSQGVLMVGVNAESLFRELQGQEQDGVRVYKIFVQHGFHIPLHWLTTVINTDLSPQGVAQLLKAKAEGGDEDEADAQQFTPPLMRLSADIGGGRITAFREDAQGKSKKIANSPVLATAGISLQLHHSFPLLPPRNKDNAGELTIGRVLQGSQVMVTHSIFNRSTTASFARPILSHTVGMNVGVHMLHGQPKSTSMPSIDATFTRQVSKKGVFIFQVGTGTRWSIPLPFGIKWVGAGNRFLPGNASASIGWTSGKSRNMEEDDDDVEEEEGDENEGAEKQSQNGNSQKKPPPKKKNKPSRGKTSIGVYLHARQISQGLGILKTTVEMGRTFFSKPRRAGQDPSTPRPNSHKGIRLGFKTSVGLTPVNTFSLGITAHRPIGNTSKIGLELMLDPSSSVSDGGGLVLSFIFRRLGQRISVPVTISSFFSVEDLIERGLPLWATTLAATAALWAGWEYFILRPSEARELRYLRGRRIRANRLTRIKKRSEAEEAVQLMREAVTRKMQREHETGGLVINKARYCGLVDVTVPIASLVEQSKVTIPGRVKFGKMVGFWEPEMKRSLGDRVTGRDPEPRLLEIWYTLRGVRHYGQFEEGKTPLLLPMRTHVIPPEAERYWPSSMECETWQS